MVDVGFRQFHLEFIIKHLEQAKRVPSQSQQEMQKKNML